MKIVVQHYAGAHLDEIGLMVDIDDKGFISFTNIGGWISDLLSKLCSWEEKTIWCNRAKPPHLQNTINKQSGIYGRDGY